jgi:hypothetical protein
MLDNFDLADDGTIIDRSPLAKWTKMAKVFYDAEYRKERSDIMKKAQEEADVMGTAVDEIARNKALRDLELKYYGDPDANPKINPTARKLITGTRVEVTTEVLVVPIDSRNEPEFDKATLATLDISNKRKSQIYTLLKDSNYYRPEDGFLEISYVYGQGCSDKQQAGQSSMFNGVSREMSLKVAFPEVWDKWKGKVDELAKTPEDIIKRNFKFSSNVSSDMVVEKIKGYLSKEKFIIPNIDCESEDTKKIAKDILESGVIDLYPKVKSQIEVIVAAAENNADDASTENGADVNTDDAVLAGSNSIDDLTRATSLSELDEVNLDKLGNGEESGSDIDNI